MLAGLRSKGPATTRPHVMEILFLSVTLAMPAVAVGLHWKHSTRNRCGAVMGAIADHVGERQTVREEPAAKLAASMNAAMASAEEQFAAIMVHLERIEVMIDLLPDKVL